MSKRIIKRTQRHTPQLATVRSVCKEAEVLEEHEHVPAIRDWCRRNRAIGRTLNDLLTWAWRFPAPLNPAGGAFKTDRQKFLVLDRCYKNRIVAERGRGMAGRKSGPPNHVCCGIKVDREVGVAVCDARCIGSSELPPVGWISGEEGDQCERGTRSHGSPFLAQAAACCTTSRN